MKMKTKKNRIAVMFLAMIMALSMMLTACGGNDAESSKIDTESSVTTTKDESSKANAKEESSKTTSKEESSKTNVKEESSKTASSESSKTNTKDESSKTSAKDESSKTTSAGSNNSTTSKPASGGSTSSTGSTGSTGSSGSTGSTTAQGCSHNWQPVYATVHHDAVTHTETVQTGTTTVVVTDAWDENVVVGEQAYIHFGDGTDWDYDPNNVTEEFQDRIEAYMVEHGVGYSVMSRPIYETVHHEAITREDPVYEERIVTDQAAYDEQVVTGYKCSKCGATK